MGGGAGSGWFGAAVEAVGASGPLQAALVVLASVLVARLVDVLIVGGLGRLARRTRTEVDERVAVLLHVPVRVSVVLLGIWLAVLVLGFSQRTETFLIASCQTLAVVLWVTFAIRLAGYLLEVASRAGTDRGRLVQPRTLPLLQNGARLVLFGLAVYLLLLAWDIDPTAWLASAGILGIAIGFAAKDTLANLFSGLFILADAPYKVGDYVVLESGERGEVTHIGLRSTRILTRDDVEITLPNALIASSKIVNESGGPSRQGRLRVKVGVAYGSDVDLVRETLMRVAAECDEVVVDPEPRVRFRAFGDSGLDFELLVWIAEASRRGMALDLLNTAVYKAFAAAGIEIPYPKRDVYLHQVAPAASTGSE